MFIILEFKYIRPLTDGKKKKWDSELHIFTKIAGLPNHGAVPTSNNYVLVKCCGTTMKKAFKYYREMDYKEMAILT